MGQLVDGTDDHGQNKPEKVFYERNVPNIEDTECACGEGEETVRHILTELAQFGEMSRTLWADEVREAKYNWNDLRTILTTPTYLKKAAGFMQKRGLLEVILHTLVRKRCATNKD